MGSLYSITCGVENGKDHDFLIVAVIRVFAIITKQFLKTTVSTGTVIRNFAGVAIQKKEGKEIMRFIQSLTCTRALLVHLLGAGMRSC